MQLDPAEEKAWWGVICVAKANKTMQRVDMGPLQYVVTPSGMVIRLEEGAFAKETNKT
jgi:hypothetical protein